MTTDEYGEGNRLPFFHTVRQLHHRAPGSVPIGHLGPAGREPVRLFHDPRLIFAASDISKIEKRSQYTVVTSTFLGLTGAVSPLATFLAEEVLRAEDVHGNYLRLFYDFIHHRILSLLYRGWLKYRPAYQYASDANDEFTRRALAFVGLSPNAGNTRSALEPLQQLSLAPILSTRVRSARYLELVLRRAFPGVPVFIQSFVLRSAAIDDSQRTRLGIKHTTLGQDFTIGERVRDRSCRFRVKIGPVTLEQSESFLPGGREFPRLRSIVDQFTRGILEAELEVQLDADATPSFRLAALHGSVLGVSTRFPSRATGRTVTRVLLTENTDELRPIVETESA